MSPNINKRICLFFVLIGMLIYHSAGAISSIGEGSLSQVVLISRLEHSKNLASLTLQDVVDRGKTTPEFLERYGDIAISAENATENSTGNSEDHMDRVQPSQVMTALSLAGVDLSHVLIRTADDGKEGADVSKKEEPKNTQTVLVANNSIVSGASVTASSFHEEKQVLNEAGDFIRSISELGTWSWEVLQSIAAGEPVRRGSLKSPMILQKGSVVTLSVKNQRFQVHALGRVKEVLDSGASVSVENLDSKKVVIGRPMNANEVEIVF